MSDNKWELWKAHNLSETQSILIHDLCKRAYLAGQNDLKKENARLREALGFYADNKNCANPDSCFIYEIDKDGEEIADEGYTARQALAELDKMKGDE